MVTKFQKRDVVRGMFVVSTVELAPIYGGYETMVFPCDAQGKVTDYLDIDSRRYSNAQDAAVGHDAVVAHWYNMTR